MTTKLESSPDAQLQQLLREAGVNTAVTEAMRVFHASAPLVPMLMAQRPAVSFAATTRG
ncbi:hypothetical protein [Arthrobacter sp. Soil762]|uniref:hypothetical protein n=1 Tax=Arthrobacter sp. Soil762 TaxID=1736401 RepID=UPI0012E3E856|nr:hypothetical protein [Arthrobacter sp. Soil762]